MVCIVCNKYLTNAEIAECDAIGLLNIYCSKCLDKGLRKLVKAVISHEEGRSKQTDRHNVEEGE